MTALRRTFEGILSRVTEGRLFGQVLLDLRHAGRTILRTPSFALALLSLGLGIGATTAVYHNVDWLLRRPPTGVAEPERLVTVQQGYVEMPDFCCFGLSRAQFDGFSDLQDVFTDVAAYSKFIGVAATETNTNQVVIQFVSGTYFRVMGARPGLGRLIIPEDDVEGAPPVAVLAHAFWTSALGADPDIVGREIRVNASPMRVIGVMPEDFEDSDLDFNGPAGVFLPIQSGASVGADGFLRATTLRVVGRMPPGRPLAPVQERVRALFTEVPPPPESNQRVGTGFFRAVPTTDTRLADVNRDSAFQFLGSLLAVCALVLLAASFNLASVVLGKALVRQREMAMRVALGASRGRLLQQSLIEVGIVGGLSAAVAVAFGWLVAKLLAPLPSTYLLLAGGVTPVLTPAAVEPRFLAYTLLLSLACVAVFGLLPSVLASVRAPAAALKAAGPTWSWSTQRVTPRQIVLVLQIALSVTIGVVAGLYARSFARAASVPSDYADPERLLVLRMVPPRSASPEEYLAFQRELRTRVQALPEVASASVSWNPPYAGGRSYYKLPSDPTREIEAGATGISPRFFQTHGVRVLAGREFSEGEENDPGVVINQTLASLLWPNGDVVGQTVLYGRGDGTPIQVLGVVADEHCNDLLAPAAPCGWRSVGGTRLGFFHVRVRSGEPMALVPAVRAIARELSPDAALAVPMTMQDRIDEITGSKRTAAAISLALAGFALVLVGLGCASLFLAMVNGSLREIAIRVALGAGESRVAGRILAHGLGLTVIGVGIGIAVARWLSSRLSSQLYQVSASDPITYAVVPLFVVLIGFLSVGLAARAAARTEPMRHLQTT